LDNILGVEERIYNVVNGMDTTVLTTGLACIVAAIIGGGLKAFGLELPVLQSQRRQFLLAAFGFILLIAGLLLQKTAGPSSSSAPGKPVEPQSKPIAESTISAPVPRRIQSSVPEVTSHESGSIKAFSEEATCESGRLGSVSEAIMCNHKDVIMIHDVSITVAAIMEDSHDVGWVNIRGSSGGNPYKGDYRTGDVVTLHSQECETFRILVGRIKSAINWNDIPPNDVLRANLSIQGKCRE
jgi:hypothetical protein